LYIRQGGLGLWGFVINVRETAFYEVRHTLVTPSNSKDTLFGRCAIPYDLATLPPNKSRQRPRTAPRAEKVGT
jgi:hypothetical protein